MASSDADFGGLSKLVVVDLVVILIVEDAVEAAVALVWDSIREDSAGLRADVVVALL